MSDFEYITRALETQIHLAEYLEDTYVDAIPVDLLKDALALLNEQAELLRDAHAMLKEQIENGLHEWNKGYRAGCEAMKKLL